MKILIMLLIGFMSSFLSAEELNKPIEFELADIQGNTHHIKEWDDHIILLNFWATWCPPCRREIPSFINIQEKYKNENFTVIGIAIDNTASVKHFVDYMGINYPILVGRKDAVSVAKAYGNKQAVLPFSVLIDQKGQIVYKHLGELSEQDLEQWLSAYYN